MARTMVARLTCLTQNSLMGPYNPIYETFVVNFLQYFVFMLLFSCLFLMTGDH